MPGPIARLSLIQPWVLSLLRQRLPYEGDATAPVDTQGQHRDWRQRLDVGR